MDMDEILIGEKKYVSSKRAAKVTGYAKDYIGQLCREGRVPARLVGRSWYVLETAIHDHRFGDQKIEQEVETAPPTSGLSTTWESPRYEASSAEILPSLNRLQDNEVPQHLLQDSWRAWFDRRIADTKPPVALAKEPEIEKIEKEEVNIPIHAVYGEPPKELLPHRHMEIELKNDNVEEVQTQKGGRGPMWDLRGPARVINVFGALLAILVATLAVINTGYFDEYITSHSQVGIIAGVTLYNK